MQQQEYKNIIEWPSVTLKLYTITCTPILEGQRQTRPTPKGSTQSKIFHVAFAQTQWLNIAVGPCEQPHGCNKAHDESLQVPQQRREISRFVDGTNVEAKV